MKKTNILGVEVKTENVREEKLVNTLNGVINDCKKWRDEDTFKNNTFAVLYDSLKEVNHQFGCLFYMNLTNQINLVKEIQKEFNINVS